MSEAREVVRFNTFGGGTVIIDKKGIVAGGWYPCIDDTGQCADQWHYSLSTHIGPIEVSRAELVRVLQEVGFPFPYDGVPKQAKKLKVGGATQ